MNSKKTPPSLKEDFISRLAPHKKHFIALSVLFILPFILYSAIFLGGEQLFGNDVLQWRAGAEGIIQYQETHEGENPLWAPNMFSGMPGYTISMPEPVPNIDTLIKAISGSTYPLPFYWVLLGGLYFFFAIQGFRPLTSATASIFFGFTTYLPIIIEAGHYNKFLAYAFIPWMLAGYWMLSRSKKKWLGLFIFALSVTLELRAHHPQVTYYFLYLLGFWWLFDTGRMYRQQQLKSWLSRTGLMIGGGLLAMVCSLEAYWSLYEYAQFSTRGGSTLGAAAGGGLSMQYAFQWSQGFGELLTLIIPGLFGGASGQAYWGPKPFTSGPHYLGAIAFILALIGVIRYKKNIKYLFLGVGLLTVLFSLGHHFRLLNGFMFNFVPFFDKFRTPEMWLTVSVFCFSVLAVYGIRVLFEWARQKKKDLKPLYLPLGIALGIGVLFAFGSNALLSFEKPGQRQQIARQLASQNNLSPQDQRVQATVSRFIDNRIKPERKELARTDSIRYLILALLASALIVGFYKQKISAGFFLSALLILAAYDMLSVGGRYTGSGDLKAENLSAEQVLQSQKRPIDTFITKHIESGEGYPYRVFPLLDNPFNNAIPAYFYPSIGGYSGAKLAYYDDMIDHILMPEGAINMAVLDMLNVKYITYNQPLPFPNTRQVYKNGNNYVIENTDVLPKAFFVDSVITVSTPKEAAQLMKPNSGFKPAHHAIVETDENITITPDSTAQVQVTSYNAKKITLETQSNQKGFLVLSEVYYPAGWEATINGEPARIYKTNFVLRGIVVPEGSHQIQFVFEPQSIYWGSLFAWIGHGVLLVLGIVCIGVFIKNRDDDESQEK